MDDGMRWYFQTSVGAPHDGAIGTEEVKARLSGIGSGSAQITTVDGTSRSLEEIRRWIAETDGGREAPRVAAPVGLRIDGAGRTLRLRWPWREGQRAGRMALAMLAGMACVAFVIATVLALLGVHVPGFVTVAGILAFGLGYPVLALLVNATEIVVEGRTLSVRHGPMKSWRRSFDIALADVREIFVHGDHDHWTLNVRDGRGTHVLLVAPAPSEAVAALRALAEAVSAEGRAPQVSASGPERIARLLGMIEDAAGPAAESSRAEAPTPEPSSAQETARPDRGPVDRSGLVVERRGDGPHGTLTVIRPWRSPLTLGIFAGTMVFAVLLLLVFFVEGDPSDPARLIGLPIFLLASAYVPAALAFNRTRFVCAGRTLEVRVEPLPWPGRKSVRVDDFAQIYIRQRASLDQSYRNPNYVLEALTRDGRTVPLWKFNGKLMPEAKVRAVEAELEAFLGIADRPVAGEARDD